jgi:hypothetical protein
MDMAQEFPHVYFQGFDIGTVRMLSSPYPANDTKYSAHSDKIPLTERPV